jgi:hypothetical protein
VSDGAVSVTPAAALPFARRRDGPLLPPSIFRFKQIQEKKKKNVYL